MNISTKVCKFNMLFCGLRHRKFIECVLCCCCCCFVSYFWFLLQKILLSGRAHLFSRFAGDFPSITVFSFLFLVVCLFHDKKNVSEILPEEKQQIFVKRKLLSLKWFFSTGTENTHRRKEKYLRAENKINHSTYHYNSGNLLFSFHHENDICSVSSV